MYSEKSETEAVRNCLQWPALHSRYNTLSACVYKSDLSNQPLASTLPWPLLSLWTAVQIIQCLHLKPALSMVGRRKQLSSIRNNPRSTEVRTPLVRLFRMGMPTCLAYLELSSPMKMDPRFLISIFRIAFLMATFAQVRSMASPLPAMTNIVKSAIRR